MKSRLNLKAISLDIDDTVWDYELGFRRGMTSALSKLNELDPLSAKMTNEEHFIEIREQYNQSNSYSGGASGSLIDVDGTDWANLPPIVPAAQMIYRHVARGIAPSFDGEVLDATSYNTGEPP